MSRRPRGSGGRSGTGRPGPDQGWRALRRSHPRSARLLPFVPLALVVSVLVLLLGLPWWTLAVAVALLAYVLIVHS